MSYTVLARKYRSKTFDDLVGQEAVATTLKNAVASDRVHHGYLFTGTRGVGKTSTARILAKALNCLNVKAPTPTPCCTCESCRMVAEGEDLDVIEIDAASNTGVDNIRELRGNAVLRPARSRFKIYIIDEVHMLSTGAFNALLKTLEEPPDHVKFILATTEIQKVPATIISRCQRFDFRSIGVDAIAAHLRTILEAESIEGEETAIRRIARLANGSMRDALSLLDQLLSFGSGRLTAEMLDDVLPVVHDEVVMALVERVAEDDAAGVLECVERSISGGQTPERFCDTMVGHLHVLMLLNVCGSKTDLIDVSGALRDELAAQAGRFDADTFVYMINLMEETRRSVKSSSAPRALLDAALVRMALAKNFSNIETLINRLESASNAAGGSAAKKKRPASSDAGGLNDARERSTSAASSPKSGPDSVKASVKGSVPPRKQARRIAARPAEMPQVSSADKAAACRDPNVQRAMELFDGSLASVRRVKPKDGGGPSTSSSKDGDDVAASADSGET